MAHPSPSGSVSQRAPLKERICAVAALFGVSVSSVVKWSGGGV